MRANILNSKEERGHSQEKLTKVKQKKHHGRQHFLLFHVCHMGFMMDLSRFKWLWKPWDSSSSLFLKPVLSLPSIPLLWLSHDSVICNTLRYTLQHKLHLHNFTQRTLTPTSSHCLAPASLCNLHVRQHDNLNPEPFTPAKSVTV